MSDSICFVIIAHRVDDSFRDLVLSLRKFCPGVDVVWYDSGETGLRSDGFGLPVLPNSRPLEYGRIASFFLDMFEWAAEQDYEYVVNLETDMAFVRPGFVDFVRKVMGGVDYLAPRFRRNTSPASQWPPFRALRPVLSELLEILGMSHTNRCFNPGQVFRRSYFEAFVSSGIQADLRGFVERSARTEGVRALQEILLPTLAERLGLSCRSYPPHLATFNRYRPYQGRYDVEVAGAEPEAYFLHPVRRTGDDFVRSVIGQLVEEPAGDRRPTSA